jgi:hypothetical protein
VRVQIHSFEDGGLAAVLLYPDGRRTLDMPRENELVLDELPGRGGG